MQLLSLDCSTLPSICILYCWVLSKEVSSTIFKVFGMTQPGIEPKSPRPLANTLLTRPMSWFTTIMAEYKKRTVIIFLFKRNNYIWLNLNSSAQCNKWEPLCNFYRNTKVKVCSPDGDTEYFDIVAGVLQGDTLAPYLFIICLDYMLRTSIDKIRENSFELTKKRSRRYPAKTITDADYAYDIAILANTPNQAKTLLHSLEWATAGIGLHVNAHKMEYMSYNQTSEISTLDCGN